MTKLQTKKLLLLILITSISLYSITKIKIGNTNETDYFIYSIQFEYFGIDPIKLEKLITIPLEEKISELDSIYQIQSPIQYNKSVTTILFYKTTDIFSTYQNLTQIADDLYNSLPSNVQKPQITGSDINQKTSICISFNTDKGYLEKNIKPLLESIDGVTEVLITGGTNEIINITYSPQKLSSLNITPFNLSDTINNENSTNLFLPHEKNDFLTTYFFNNTCPSLTQLEKTILTDKQIPLSSLSSIQLHEESQNELVLLNDVKTIFVNIKTNPEANIIHISSKCQKLLKTENFKRTQPIIIYDQGQIQKSELLSTTRVLCSTIFISIILIFLIYQNYNILFLCIIEILLTIIWTLSTFPLYNQFIIPILKHINTFKTFKEFSINSNSLSGLSLSIGLITDVLLVTYELYINSRTKTIYNKNFSKLSASAITSTATTTIAVIPLFSANSFISGISTSAFTIILMLIYSTIISLIFLPVFFKNKNNISSIVNFTSLKLTKLRPISTLIKNYYTNQKHAKTIFLFLTILSIILFIFTKKNIEPIEVNNIIYAQINFNPEKSKESVQADTLPFIRSLQTINEITYIKSESSRGHSDLEIVYKNISEHKISKKIKSKKNLIPNAFLFLSETSANKKSKPITLQISVTGDNESKCRNIAKEAATLISQNKLAIQTVLNFTDEETMYLFTPDQNKLSKLNLSISDFSELLRANIFSPVISKYFYNNKETDVKLKNSNLITLQNLEQQEFLNSIPLSSLGQLNQTTIPSKIYRDNCRPCAYFSIELNKNNLKSSIRKIKNLMNKIKLDDNYFINLPSKIEETQTSYSLLTISIIICLICIYIFLASFNENLNLSLKILLTIPASLCIPISIRFITNTSLNFGDLTGIILLSGIVINNSIYISESTETSVIEKINSKYESIIITSFTTILSSLPMIFLSSSPFIQSMSFFMFFGTLGSIIVSLFVFPQLIKNT